MTVAIGVEGVGKRFRIPLDRSSTLKHRMTHWRSTSRYRVLEALHDVSFEIPYGQFCGIIGHNGSGKSTLLKILSRIYRPDTGKLAVNGRVSPFLELGVGFNPELSARDNIFLNGAILGISRGELRKRVDEILAFAGEEVQSQSEQKLKNFSSGMQVRLAFSVAIQADAGILLMDEVLAVGDAEFQQKCFDVFARYKREGRTIVLVTHEINAVNMYCDRALLLDHGRLVADGPAGEVTTRYRRDVGALMEEAAGGEPGQQDRWGSREVTIVGVRLLDAHDEAVHVITPGSRVTAEMDYEIQNDDVHEFTCRFGFKRVEGVPLSVPALNVSRPRGGGRRGTVRYRIPALPYLDGVYLLDAEVNERSSGHVYDHIDGAVRFTIVNESMETGMVSTGGEWHVDRDTERSGATPSRTAGTS